MTIPEYLYHLEQNTDAWLCERIASIGGTAIDKIAPGGKPRKDLLYQFAGAYITKVPPENFKFQHADRGHQFEPETRDAYSIITGNEVKQVGLVRSGPHKHYSADGLIGDDGILEIKVRIQSVFIMAAIEGYAPIGLRRQVQWGLWVCDREWADYIQYCPELADNGIPPIIQRIYRDEKPKSKREQHVTGKDLDEAAEKFISEMLAIVEKIRGSK